MQKSNMGSRSLLGQAIAATKMPDIKLSCSYQTDPAMDDIYADNASFQEHIKRDLAYRLAELICERMDYRVEPALPGTRYTASMRALNQTQWEDLERQVDHKASLNQIVVLNTNDH